MYLLPQVADLKSDILSVKQSLDSLTNMMNQARGGSTVMSKVADILLGALGAILTLIISHYWR